MGWVVLAVFALLLFLGSNYLSWTTASEQRDTFWRQHDADEQAWWKKFIEREKAKLAQKHEDELIDLRRRCINYVVAMREADVAAGKEPFAGMAFDIAMGSVPLRVGKDA